MSVDLQEFGYLVGNHSMGCMVRSFPLCTSAGFWGREEFFWWGRNWAGWSWFVPPLCPESQSQYIASHSGKIPHSQRCGYVQHTHVKHRNQWYHSMHLILNQMMRTYETEICSLWSHILESDSALHITPLLSVISPPRLLLWYFNSVSSLLKTQFNQNLTNSKKKKKISPWLENILKLQQLNSVILHYVLHCHYSCCSMLQLSEECGKQTDLSVLSLLEPIFCFIKAQTGNISKQSFWHSWLSHKRN